MHHRRLLERLLTTLAISSTVACSTTGGECPSGTTTRSSCYRPQSISPALAAHCQGESGYTRLLCRDGTVQAIAGWPISMPCEVLSFERRCAPGDVKTGTQLGGNDPCGSTGAGGAGGAGGASAGSAGAGGSCLQLPALEGNNLSTTQQLFECLGQRPGTGGSEVLTENRESGSLLCCYDFTAPILCGEGRPLWVAGERVAAPLVGRMGWA